MKTTLKYIFIALLFFNILNTIFMFIQYYYDSFFIQILIQPWVIQRRSFLSFIVLTCITYLFLYKSYKLKWGSKINNPMAIILFTLSIYTQFLSVQYMGAFVSAKNIPFACEYYSFISIRKIEFMPNIECYHKCELIGDKESLSWYLMYSSSFFKCHTITDNIFFQNLFIKKYDIGNLESMYVLNGIGPFFALNIDKTNDLH